MDKLNEADVLRFALAEERIQRAAAQLALAQAERETLRLDVSIRYSLTSADNFNAATGQITRTPPAPSAPAIPMETRAP